MIKRIGEGEEVEEEEGKEEDMEFEEMDRAIRQKEKNSRRRYRAYILEG